MFIKLCVWVHDFKIHYTFVTVCGHWLHYTCLASLDMMSRYFNKLWIQNKSFNPKILHKTCHYHIDLTHNFTWDSVCTWEIVINMSEVKGKNVCVLLKFLLYFSMCEGLLMENELLFKNSRHNLEKKAHRVGLFILKGKKVISCFFEDDVVSRGSTK